MAGTFSGQLTQLLQLQQQAKPWLQKHQRSAWTTGARSDAIQSQQVHVADRGCLARLLYLDSLSVTGVWSAVLDQAMFA